MIRRATVFLLLATLWGCAPEVRIRREGGGAPVDPGELVERLERYNSAPDAVRVEGKLRVRGKGRAEFGAQVVRGRGFRLDAVAGPFSKPILALACGGDLGCEAYVPERSVLLVDGGRGWEEWLEMLLRGRVPLLGATSGALAYPSGLKVLRRRDRGGWTQEVEFGPGSGPPNRTVVYRGREALVSVSFTEHFPVEGHPFPGRISTEVYDPEREFELEFRRVVPDARLTDGVLTIAVPPGTAVESARGSTTWNELGIPLWLPIPDG